jgi:hypothetical protein
MRFEVSANNPVANVLPPGVTEQHVTTAIEGSGYPLQSIVASTLATAFTVEHEWAYIDSESGSQRTLDLLAYRYLFDRTSHRTVRVRPRLDLLIECKRADLPYVFFVERSSGKFIIDFPRVVGLRSPSVTLRTNDSRSTYTSGVTHVLSLDKEEFVSGPTLCSTFSKCVRKGPGLELSGSEAYSGLVQPLVKAQRHLSVAASPRASHVYFDGRLSIAIGVLDAPMLAVDPADGGLATWLPWVRCIRREYDAKAEWSDREQEWYLDIVHSSFLSEYITRHVMPFAELFGKRAIRHAETLANGKGFAKDMEVHGFRDIEPRLRV